MRFGIAKFVKIQSAVLLTTALVLAGVGTANAGPFDPAYRGDENSVHAIFDWVTFNTDWNVTLFDSVSSTYPLNGTAPSASDDGLDTTVKLPNFIDELPLKRMRIQMGFDGAVPADLIRIDVTPYDPDPTSWQIVDSSTGLASFHYIDVEITPNPDWEELTIFGDTGANIVPGNLLTIEVDTVSVPEPATLSLMGLGGLAMMRRRR